MNKKVLVVDDSLTARRLLISQIAELKLDMVEAGDGVEGLQKLAENPDIAIIFSDINMPNMTGLEMIANIKKDASFAKIPVCMLTTETGADALVQAKELGVNSFLVKPIRKEQIVAVVNGLLQKPR